jgi:hypothetical protein
MTNRNSQLLGLLCLGLAACGAEFAPGSRVSDFRLITVGADAPYAAPGETVHVTALWHEPFGRSVNFTWMTCENPADTSALGCLAKIAQDARVTGTLPVTQSGPGLDQVDITIAPSILDAVPSDSLGNAMVGVVTVACPGTLTLLDPAAVAPNELPFVCIEEGSTEALPFERYAVAVKRIFVRQSDRNENPGIAEVTWDGAPWPDTEVKQVKPCSNDPDQLDDCKGGQRPRLGLALTPGSVESGRDSLGRDFQEQVVIQYYATEGTFEFEVRTADSPHNRWAARKRASGAMQTLWFVARDNRGGVGWTTRQVAVQ